MTKEEWEEYGRIYESDWRVRIAAGVDVGNWKYELPKLKEVLHVEPNDKVLSIIVKNTESNELCAFDLEGNLDGTESVSVTTSWLEDEANDTPKEKH